MSLKGKVALVTGGSSGIGRVSALAFAGEGAKVTIADVNVKGGEETVGTIDEAGGEAMFVKADVSKAADVEALIERVVERYGRLDCAFNNAGVDNLHFPVGELLEEEWDHVRGYVNRCVNVIRRRPSQPLIQWRFHPHTVHRGRRLRSTQGPSDA